MNKRIIAMAAASIAAIAVWAGNSDVGVAKGLTKRLLPRYADKFQFRKINSERDSFCLWSEKGWIVIGGNNANSMAVGLNHYLKNYCFTTVSWYKDDPIELPAQLPAVEGRVGAAARMPMRFFLNYCTYGYTMPWWSWADWEHFIDWMALNGVNLPLAITGQEAVWYNVWKRYGLSDSDIRSFFTGPAFLGWHRMCNIDAYMGPLPMDWITAQAALQKKIVAREREFAMKPVLPAFAGHVPTALLKLYPNADATPVSDWGGFATPELFRCNFLNSSDPLYAKIQRDFLTEQTRMYGTDHLYGIDPFNEVDPPTLNADTLAMISKGIYNSLAAVDNNAVWVQMGWAFYYKKYWTKELQKAVFKAVPQDRLLMLDYWAENKEMWRRSDSYFGQPFLWCYLCNFGGRDRLMTLADRIYTRVTKAMAETGGNLKGVGGTLEAFDVNQFPYEWTLSMAWDVDNSLQTWYNNLADVRMGRVDAAARRAYADYNTRVLNVHRAHDHTMLEKRPTMKVADREKANPARAAQTDVWRQLLALNGTKDAYKMDVVNVGRQCLADKFYVLWRKFVLAYDIYDLQEMERLGTEMEDIITDCAALTACHPVFSLGNWVTAARAWGATPEAKKYYERNALTLLTTWSNNIGGINDYAGRPWDGLLTSYYLPRWQMFIADAIASRKKGKDFDEKKFERKCFAWEQKFANGEVEITYPQRQDAITLSKKLYEKHFGGNPQH